MTPRDPTAHGSLDGEAASAAVVRADALDALGRHDEAINTLAQAARGGDAAAKGRVGARILIGDRAPAFPEQGAGLVAEAARDGDTDAAALLAVLAAAGAYRAQDWDEALDWLQRAAERGSALARGQLAALTGDRALANESLAPRESPPTDLWRRLRETIDLPALLAAPAGETLSPEPLIRRFSAFASPPICDWLIGRARLSLVRATVYDGRSEIDEVAETRTNSIRIFSLTETDVVQIALQHRMAAAAGFPFPNMEALSVLHYAPGEQITEHYDFISPASPGYDAELRRHGQRAVTFLVYLNDDHEGGETEFPRLALRHKGVRGEGLFFTNALASGAPDLRSQHAGRPPQNGEKWIVSQFIRSRPFVPGAASA